jgi:hypothetical protein
MIQRKSKIFISKESKDCKINAIYLFHKRMIFRNEAITIH